VHFLPPDFASFRAEARTGSADILEAIASDRKAVTNNAIEDPHSLRRSSIGLAEAACAPAVGAVIADSALR
jgi:hypothetical protein